MTVKQQILQLLSSQPELEQAVGRVTQQMAQDPDVNFEAVTQVMRMFEFALQNPDSYAQLRAQMLDSGIVDAEDLPEQFDERAIVVILAALYMLQSQLAPQGGTDGEPPAFARGGLNDLRSRGRNGDTMLAHISPFEARILQSYGGSGRINPDTGLHEYGLFSSLKKVFKAVAPFIPIALSIFAPGVGTAIGSALGASGMGAAALGGAALGAGSAALGGGDVLKGATMGGLGGGLGSIAGGAANSALGTNLGASGQAMLGGALTGGVTGALSGQGALQGALQGGALSGLAQAYGPAAGGSKYDLSSGGSNMGLQAGTGGLGLQSPGAYSGAASEGGVDYGLSAPAQARVPGYGPGDFGSGLAANLSPAEIATSGSMRGSAPTGALGKIGMNLPTAAAALPLMSLLGGAKTPQQVQSAASSMSPEQREYFNRPLQSWDWNKLTQDAQSENQDLGSYIARNWNRLSGGEYNVPAAAPAPTQLARGGLGTVARLARGAGSGRADTIDAKLSDGEYVMDAETVSLLGDGSTQDGARRLDEMRAKIRQHKGKSMARGKFSANAKSPLSYLKESV